MTQVPAIVGTSTVEKYVGKVRELSYNLGVAHTKLIQIEAPKTGDTEPDDMSRQGR